MWFVNVSKAAYARCDGLCMLATACTWYNGLHMVQRLAHGATACAWCDGLRKITTQEQSIANILPPPRFINPYLTHTIENLNTTLKPPTDDNSA